MDEVTYLRERDILVTSTRVELAGQTFAVRNIGSVKVTHKGAGLGSILTILIGLSVLSAGYHSGAGAVIIGVLLTGAGAAWLWQRMTERTLVLVTGGGEVAAYKSRNRRDIEAIRVAVATAISTR